MEIETATTQTPSPDNALTFHTPESTVSMARSTTDPFVSPATASKLLKFESRQREILKEFMALEKRAEELTTSVYNVSNVFVSVAALSFLNLKTLKCDPAWKILGLTILLFLLNFLRRREVTRKLVILKRENETLLNDYTNLVYEAGIVRDIEQAKVDSSHDGGFGSEVADESEGILIARTVFFKRIQAIAESKPYTGFDSKPHICERMASCVIMMTQIYILVFITMIVYSGFF